MDHCRHARHRHCSRSLTLDSWFLTLNGVDARIQSSDPDGLGMTASDALYSPAIGGCYGTRASQPANIVYYEYTPSSQTPPLGELRAILHTERQVPGIPDTRPLPFFLSCSPPCSARACSKLSTNLKKNRKTCKDRFLNL